MSAWSAHLPKALTERVIVEGSGALTGLAAHRNHWENWLGRAVDLPVFPEFWKPYRMIRSTSSSGCACPSVTVVASL